jgi:hypothetical protein
MKTQLPRYAVLITRKNGSTKQVGSFGDRAKAVEYGEKFFNGRYHIADRDLAVGDTITITEE